MAMNDQIEIIDLKKAIHLDGNTLSQISRPGTVILPYYDLLKEHVGISKYRNSDIYGGQINDVTLVLNKYFFRNQDQKLIHGGLTYNDNTIVDENIDPFGFNRGRQLISGKDHLGYDELRIGKTVKINDPSAIWIGGQTTPEPFFGHWLHEHLAKFLILEKMGILNGTIYLNATLPKRYLDWIPLLSKGNWQFKFVEKDSNLTFSKILIPSTVNYRSRYNYQITMWLHGLIELRRRLVKNTKMYDIDNSKSELPKALYVKRNSKWRNITNEIDVINCLKNFFQIDIISFENFLPIEQIEIIRKYKYIFGASGSAMPITMFAIPNSTVIEFFNPLNEGKWASKIYCDIFGIKHIRIDGVTKDELLGPTPADRDFEIDLSKLIQILTNISLIEILKSDQMDSHDFNGTANTITAYLEDI